MNMANSNFLLLTLLAQLSLFDCKSTKFDVTDFSLTGFASGVVGGGVIPETDGRYRHVYNAQDLHDALMDPSSKVIEIMNDLNLGFYEIPESLRGAGVFEEHDVPLAHPKLMQTGVSHVFIRNRNTANGNPGLTIFSDKGVTIRHCNLEINNMEDFVLRNLRFDEMFEWDDESRGDHDINEWDYITVRNGDGLWFDHLEFNRAYDGTLDILPNTRRVTISWVLGLSANNGTDPFYVQQFDYLEANRNLYPNYDSMRNRGITKAQIEQITSPQKKGHLVGPEELQPGNENLSVTFANSVYIDLQQRLPRLRAGNSHLYNVIVDCRIADQARILRATLPATPEYNFAIQSLAPISTEHGAVMVENTKLLEIQNPMRNNQKDASNPTFTGKMWANNVYRTYRGNEYTGNSTVGSPLYPGPADVIPFSWNGFTELPYQYHLVHLDDLDLLLLGPTGAGARDLQWEKENWLKTSY